MTRLEDYLDRYREKRDQITVGRRVTAALCILWLGLGLLSNTPWLPLATLLAITWTGGHIADAVGNAYREEQA